MENDTPTATAPHARPRGSFGKKPPRPPAAVAADSLPEEKDLPPSASGIDVEAAAAAPAEEDSRSRAARRAAELREHRQNFQQDGDEFYIDPRVIPDGWDYQWKLHKLLGQEDRSKETLQQYNGWEPVPVSRHPWMMPQNYSGSTIERKGMVLKERPKEITDDERQRERRTAEAQVRTREAQLSSAGPGQFERSKSNGESLVKLRTEYAPIPKDS